MKTLSLLTTVTLLTCFVSGCDSPKADTSPNSRKADEAPPLVGPDVEVWKLTLHVDATQSLEGISWEHTGGRGSALPIVNGGGEARAMIERPIGQKDRASFEGTWEAEMRTRDHPSSVVACSRLTLSPDGSAEFMEEEGHDEFREGSYTDVVYVREKITRHLIGKWRQRSDTTATVWLEPAPLVGPDVEIWKLTLNVRATGGYAWIDVRSDDKDMGPLDRSTPSEGVVSFEGTWESGMWTEDYPSSYMVFWRLHLAPDGGAEHVNEEGHQEFQADSQEKVIYVRDRIIRHLVGKWRQTSDTTATVWLEPAPLVGPDVEVWELTLHVDTEQGYAWVDVVGNAPTTLRGPLDGHDDQASFEGTWEDRGGTEDIPSSFMESYRLLLMPDGQAEYLQEEGHGEFDEQSETKTKYVKDKIVRHLEGKWRQTSDTTATVWLEAAGAIEE